MANPEQLNDELDRIIILMDEAQESLERYSTEWAEKENAYRRRKALTYLNATGTVDERKSIVDRECEKERLAAHVAEAMMRASMENVRNKRAQLSAWQTKAGNVRAEMDEARGPQPRWNQGVNF